MKSAGVFVLNLSDLFMFYVRIGLHKRSTFVLKPAY